MLGWGIRESLGQRWMDAVVNAFVNKTRDLNLTLLTGLRTMVRMSQSCKALRAEGGSNSVLPAPTLDAKPRSWICSGHAAQQQALKHEPVSYSHTH